MTKEVPLHIKVREVINKYDPIHLLDMGLQRMSIMVNQKGLPED